MLCLRGRITTRGSISIQVEKQACRSQRHCISPAFRCKEAEKQTEK